MTSSIVLASESPFRKQLMLQLGTNFETAKPLANEDLLKTKFKGPQTQLAEYLAKAKAESLLSLYPNSLIIGSDQVLLLNGEILNKPNSKEEVISRLNQLQGKTHELHTALAVYFQGNWESNTIVAELNMKPLTSNEIESYASLDLAIGCAGGYKIESKGPLLFNSIKTEDHFSIVGLPLLSLSKILNKFGFSPL